MLVLSRRIEESIRIGADIEIEILKMQGNRVHIGIKAPRSVRVMRSEIEQQAELRVANPVCAPQVEFAEATSN